MRDLAWLKEEVDRHTNMFKGDETDYLGLKRVIDVNLLDELIDQVEQPKYTEEDMTKYYREGYKAGVEDEKSTQMPEQPVLPVVPEFVAEDYERMQGYSGVDLAAMNYWTRNSALQCTEESHKWLLDQDMGTITRLLKGQFTVEEKKYIVYLGDGQYLVSEDKLTVQPVTIRHEEDEGFLNYKTKFTEREIKEYKGGIYWPFAKEVTNENN